MLGDVADEQPDGDEEGEVEGTGIVHPYAGIGARWMHLS